MINNSDGYVRRILTFPAVRPSENVSPATLLGSLISLARKISDFKSEGVVSAKRNAKNAIRLVGVLLVFLEELQEVIAEYRADVAPDPVTVSLSEVHLVFQRVQFLLEDCAREDARLWMLAKSEEVANSFRVAGRDFATALEVFPISLIEISDESKDCLDFVIRQARRLGFVAESGVSRAWNLTLSVLNRFERKLIPDPVDLKRIIGYLGIGDWGDCNREIKLLEEEICLEEPKEENSEAILLSSLIGFTTYSRCVVFEVGEIARGEDGGSEVGLVLLNFLNEEDLKCPITLEIMVDPVTISTGHTYERGSILKWFKAGNPICPKTGEKLESLELVPNSALQTLIKQYAAQNGVTIMKSSGRDRCAPTTVYGCSPACKGAMKMASDYLAIKLAIGSVEKRSKAAFEVRLLTKRSADNRAWFVESGVIPYLLNLLRSKDSTAQENATAALLNLSKHTTGKSAVVQNGGLKLILGVLKQGLKLESRRHAAATLFYLSSVEEYRVLIGNLPEAIPALVDLIGVGSDRAKKSAIVAIFGLLLHPSNHQKVLGANAIPLLANLLSSSDKEDLLADALGVLSALSENPEGAAAVLQAGALTTVIRILCSSASRFVREHCASLLQALCINGGHEVVQVLVKNPSVMGALYSLLTQGTPRASKKARAVIGILHEFSEKGPSTSAAQPPALPRGRFIHVWQRNLTYTYLISFILLVQL